MNGRNHLATGLALGIDACLAACLVPGPAAAALGQALSPFERYEAGPAGAAGCAACAALYVAGTVLPDVDNGGVASRWLHVKLPLAHRGWTHSVWAMLLFVLASVLPQGRAPDIACTFLWPLRFVALGMLAHDLMDALSKAGWAMFYPLGKWRKYEGTVMKRGWTPDLYSSARPGSENVVACLVVVLSAAWWGTWAYLRYFGP